MQSAIVSPRATPIKVLTSCRVSLNQPAFSSRPFPLRVAAQSQDAITADPSQASIVALQLNKYSSRITEPKSQGGSQAILHGVGLSDEDLSKPQIGISSVWYEGNT